MLQNTWYYVEVYSDHCLEIEVVILKLQGGISNILDELVVQPLLVSISALTLATETVRSILKIDDVVS